MLPDQTPSSSSLLNKLTILGVTMPTWPEEPEGSNTENGWIQAGRVYAECIGQLLAQLRSMPTSTKEQVAQLILHSRDIDQVSAWDRSIIAAIEADISGKLDRELPQFWSRLADLHNLTLAQVLGLTLEMAREQRLTLAVEGMRYLISEVYQKNEWNYTMLCAEFVASISTTALIESTYVRTTAWEGAVSLHEQMAGLMSEAMRLDRVNKMEDSAKQDARRINKNLDFIAKHGHGRSYVERETESLKPELILQAKDKKNLILLARNKELFPRKGATENKKLAICTHHKCGTSFLFKTLNQIKDKLGIKVWRKFYEPERISDDSWDIIFEQHSRIDDVSQRLRGIHCIRRPESLIYSATLYHETAREPWLDIPLSKFDHNTFRVFTEGKPYNAINDPRIEISRKAEIAQNYVSGDSRIRKFLAPYKFDGKTYRQMLKSFDSIERKVAFEMQCYSFGVISDMASFGRQENFFWIKLEDISFDLEMHALRNAFEFIGFKDQDLALCLESARKNMLGVNKSAAEGHATTGLSWKWQEIFTKETKSIYRELYEDFSEVLGY